MHSPRPGKLFPIVVLVSGLASVPIPVRAQNELPGPSANLSAAQIVQRMTQRGEVQKEELKQYRALRHYRVDYRGFSRDIEAAMDVEVLYDAIHGKSFRIVSQSGSRVLCDDVLKRAVDSEHDAMQEPSATALTEANYRFTLDGTEAIAGKPAYILSVEPVTPSKFLYRGKIWVDAGEFAVVKMETQPAKSPSFWISQTRIQYMGAKTEGFWFPHQVLSETRVRIGGTAVMKIDYGSYHVVPETGMSADASLRDVKVAAMSAR